MDKNFDHELFFEDIDVGDYMISPGKTITEADVVNFAAYTGDNNLIHTDAEYAKNSLAGQRLVHGLLPMSCSTGLVLRTVYHQAMVKQLVALTDLNWKFHKPVLIGDTIHVRQEVTEKSDPKPESKMGKITLFRTVYNQRDEAVQSGEFKLLIKKRPKNS